MKKSHSLKQYFALAKSTLENLNQNLQLVESKFYLKSQSDLAKLENKKEKDYFDKIVTLLSLNSFDGITTLSPLSCSRTI